MAQQREIDGTPGFIPLTNLRNENIVKKLIEVERIPFLLPHGDTVTCFIPANRSNSAQSFEISIADAKEIASIRDKLYREL